MRDILAGILAATILVGAGCGLVPQLDDGPGPAAALASEKERVPAPDVGDGDLDRLVDGNSAFAFDLYRLLAEQERGENLFYSPYSISLALAMTYAGAGGETEEQMAQALQFTLPQGDLHRTFNALDQELARRGEGAEGDDETRFRLHIANAIWGQDGYPFLTTFLDTLAENYGAGLRVLDFAAAPEDARLEINEWVSDQTEGKIQDLLARGTINPMTRLVLTNAIYFNATWLFPFEEALTRDGPFTLLDGREIQVPMMHQTESFGYARGTGYEAVELPYDGFEMSMVILLPDEGELEAFEESLNAARVQAIIAELERQYMALAMPKFEFDASFSLPESLQALGMSQAFTPEADFSGITGSRDLFISDVVHKTFVAVDEEGTEAAAATAVVMMESAMMDEPIAVRIDRPFVFLIRDIETGTILFVGRVVDPTA